MARAERHNLLGYVWPITHCFHKREFLLKISRDHPRWIEWLYRAKKRYRALKVLIYMITSNHVDLLAFDNGSRNVIPDLIKVIGTQNWSGIQYPQRQYRSILGGSLSCNGIGE